MSAQELGDLAKGDKKYDMANEDVELPANAKRKGASPQICKAALDNQCQVQHDLPIDKGWAWVIAITASLLFAFSGGALRAHGLIYVEVMQEYGSHPTETFWIFGVASAVAHGFAPVPGYCIQRFNHRVVIIGGGLLMSLGICITAFMPKSQYMFFTFGVIYGMGLCCALLTAFVCVGPYFKRLRTLATGIAAAGGGAGAIIFSFLLRYLFDVYTFSGAMLLYGGLMLNIIVLALLQRPITYYMRSRPTAKSQVKAEEDGIGAQKSSQGTGNGTFALADDCKMADSDGSSPAVVPGVTEKSAHLKRASTGSLAAFAGEGDANPSGITVADIIHASAHSLPKLKDEGEPAEAKSSGVSSLAYVKVLKSGVFWCIGLSIFCYAQGFSLSYSAVPPYAASIHVNKGTVTWLIAGGGVAEIVGRLSNGYFADRKLVSPTVHFCLLPLLPAVTACICPLLPDGWGIGLFLSTAGLLGSSMFPFQTAVLREQLGDECITPGLSLLFVFQTVGYVASYSMSGVLFALTGGWGQIFFYVGCVMFMASFFAAIPTILRHCQECKTQSDNLNAKEEGVPDDACTKRGQPCYALSKKRWWQGPWHMHAYRHPHVPNCIHFELHPRTHHNSIHN